MLKTIKLVAALACLGLAACTLPDGGLNVGNGNAAVATADPATACGLAAGTLVDERTLIAAETAYNVPAHAYVTLDSQGRLSAALKAQARPFLQDAYRYLLVARSAYNAGGVCELKAASEAVIDFAGRARDVLPNSN